VRRAAEYKTMGTFYRTRSARAEFLSENPVITYSHLRSIARRAEHEDQAYAIAHKASMRSWTVEKTDYMLWRWTGLLGKIDRKKVKPGKPLAELTVPWSSAANAVSEFFTDHDDIRPAQVRITIHEVQQP
jgi:hypothetical protein